jgi:hypothetical protein
VILYPARKEGFAGPLVELLGMLQSESLRADFLVSVGYSFRDERFRRLLIDAGAVRRGLRLVLVGPDADQIFHTYFETDERQSIVPAHSDPPTGIFRGRVLRIPLAFEESFWPLVTHFLPVFIRATRAEDATVREANAGQPVDWSNVAMDFAAIGFLDSLGPMEEVSPLFGDNRLKQIRYLSYKTFSLAVHGSLAEAARQWAPVVDAILSLLDRNDPVGIYDQGQSRGLCVQLNLNYPVKMGERVSRMHVGIDDMIELVSSLAWYTELYGRGLQTGKERQSFKDLTEALTRFRAVLAVYQEPFEHSRTLSSYLDLREEVASADIVAIRESLRIHSSLNQGDPADPTKARIVTLERRLYSESCEALRAALPGAPAADASGPGGSSSLS